MTAAPCPRDSQLDHIPVVNASGFIFSSKRSLFIYQLERIVASSAGKALQERFLAIFASLCLQALSSPSAPWPPASTGLSLSRTLPAVIHQGERCRLFVTLGVKPLGRSALDHTLDVLRPGPGGSRSGAPWRAAALKPSRSQTALRSKF